MSTITHTSFSHTNSGTSSTSGTWENELRGALLSWSSRLNAVQRFRADIQHFYDSVTEVTKSHILPRTFLGNDRFLFSSNSSLLMCASSADYACCMR